VQAAAIRSHSRLIDRRNGEGRSVCEAVARKKKELDQMTDTKNDTQKLDGNLLRKYAQIKGIDLGQLQQQSGLGDAAVQQYWSKDESEIQPNVGSPSILGLLSL
jgi:hypothetical protein